VFLVYLLAFFSLNLLPPDIVQHHGQLLLLIVGMCDIRLLSLVYQDMIILTVSLPIRRGTIVFLYVSSENIVLLTDLWMWRSVLV